MQRIRGGGTEKRRVREDKERLDVLHHSRPWISVELGPTSVFGGACTFHKMTQMH